MIQRLAIVAAGAAAVIVLSVGLVAAGFAPGASQDLATADTQLATAPVAAEPSLDPEVVYIKPAPKRKTVVVERQAPRSSAAMRSGAQTRQVASVRPARDYDDDGEFEGYDD
jgi:hypothetical protein